MDSIRIEQFKRLAVADLEQSTSLLVLANEFIQYNKDEEKSPNTIKTRKTHVGQFTRFCLQIGLEDVSFLTNQFIDQYFVEYRKTHSEGTTNTDKRILKVFLTWIKDYKELPVRFNPDLIRSKKMKYKTPQAISPDLIRQVIAGAEGQTKLIIALLVETGMRPIELTRILISDIHETFIDIHGKGDVDRTVTMTPVLANAVATFTSGKPGAYLFTNQHQYAGRPLTTKTVWRTVSREFEKHGIQATPRKMRHSFGVNLLQNGCDIMTIKDLLGHEYVTTTQQYLRLTDNQRRDNYNKHMGVSFYS